MNKTVRRPVNFNRPAASSKTLRTSAVEAFVAESWVQPVSVGWRSKKPKVLL